MKEFNKCIKNFLCIFLILGYFIFFILLIPFSYSQETNEIDLMGDYQANYQSLEIELNISNEILLENANVNLDLFIFPKEDYRQEVSIISIQDKDGKIIKYSEDEVEKKLSFKINGDGTEKFILISKIKTYFYNPKIKEKISFEDLFNNLNDLKDKDIKLYNELNSYSKFLEGENLYVLDDPFIRNKAEQLVKKDDLFETLNNIGDYVNKNMIYNEEEVELKNAKEIMQDKIGVCSHYAILFMALSKSLGIPVKYVTGVAYSTKDKTFREHAWVEAWLGEEGWIPYDPTFGQFGWIDAYHIKLKETIDAGTKAIEYSYTGDIQPEKIDINSQIKNKGEIKEIPIIFSIKPIIVETGLDSYVPLEIKAKTDYYFSWPVYLATAPDYFGETQKTILLKPGEQSLGYFIIHTPNTNKCEYGCISDIEIKDFFGNNAKTQIIFKKEFPIITLEDAQKVVSPEVILGTNFDFFCKTEKKYYYEYENFTALCILDNKENKGKVIDLCIDNNCQQTFINENNAKQEIFSIPLRLSNPISKNLTQPMLSTINCISAKNEEEFLGISCLDFIILRVPNIKIENPDKKIIRYGEKTIIPLQITANTNIDFNINVTNNQLDYFYEESFWLKNGKQTTGLIIDSMQMKNLKPGKYDLKTKIFYLDKNEKYYEEEIIIPIEIQNINFFEKFIVDIKRFFS